MKSTGHRGFIKTDRLVSAVLLVLLASVAVFLCACGRRGGGITSLDQLNQTGIRIGVATETAEFSIVEKEFPKA